MVERHHHEIQRITSIYTHTLTPRRAIGLVKETKELNHLVQQGTYHISNSITHYNYFTIAWLSHAGHSSCVLNDMYNTLVQCSMLKWELYNVEPETRKLKRRTKKIGSFIHLLHQQIAHYHCYYDYFAFASFFTIKYGRYLDENCSFSLSNWTLFLNQRVASSTQWRQCL